MTILKNFTTNDMYAFQGSVHFPDGTVPRIYHFTASQVEELFDLLDLEYNELCGAYIIHHAEGIALGWHDTADLNEERCWPSGDASERVEYLLEALTDHTLPLWAASVATVSK